MSTSDNSFSTEQSDFRAGESADLLVSPEDHDDEFVTRSEEVLDVSVASKVSGRVVLRKRIVTETVTQTVELRREELIIDRQPAADLQDSGDRDGDMPGEPTFVPADYEIVLHEEQVVVSKRVVPVERIRIRADVITDVVEVRDDIRREEIEMVTSDDLPVTVTDKST